MTSTQDPPGTSEFGEQLRSFLDAHTVPVAGDRRPAQPSIGDARAFQRSLYNAGLAGPAWPAEYGGLALPADQRARYADLLAQYVVPVAGLTLGLSICGPAVVEFGTDEQRARHGRATLRGDHVWCQLWSEPDAGSDLAALRTKASRRPDGVWTVSGRKVWTSGAHHSDYGLLLARTEPDIPRHRGLSMFVLDMRSPGVTVQPLRQMTGVAEFNEVTFDDVELSADALLGPRADGWRVVTWMMGQERTSVGMQMRNPASLEWADVRRLAEQVGRISEPAVRHRLVELHARGRAAELLNARVRQEAAAGSGSLLLGSAAKVAESAVLRHAGELAFEIAAAAGWAPDDESRGAAAHAVLHSPAHAIGGGTDEIQLNTLGERVLGLPRERAAETGGSR